MPTLRLPVAAAADNVPLLSGAVDFLQKVCRTPQITLAAIKPDEMPIARTFRRGRTGGVADWISRHNGSRNIYFHVNPLKDGLKHRKEEAWPDYGGRN